THTGTQPIATVAGLQAALDGKAAAGHGHAIADVSGLQAALDGKAGVSHTHTAAQISDSTAAGRAMLTAAGAAAQTALLETFTATAKGLAPASGGGTTNFLRADGTWAAPPGGGTGDVVGPASATNDALARFDGATGKLIQGSALTLSDAGELMMPHVASPALPSADHLGLFGRRIAGRMLPSFLGAAGPDSALQPFLARNSVSIWNAAGGTTVTQLGASFTVLGTATARTPATTNLFTRMKRVGLPTTTTAGNLAGVRIGFLQYSLGTGPDGSGISLGGFTMICRFGMQAVSSSFRAFVGMHGSSAAPTNANPATRTQQIGVARIDGSNNLNIVYGGTSAQTPIDLGTDFPATTTNVDFYEIALFAPAGVTETAYWQVTRLNTGHVASGTLTGGAAVLPSAATLLTFNSWISNNTDAVAVGIDWASVYLEKDI
ncbi:MAG: phage tail repeat domain-containing protein, partial [Rhodobacteraceae bacterium]|nr:phage tail repeat domain-containing protein [Paracoccaceae bacterium]